MSSLSLLLHFGMMGRGMCWCSRVWCSRGIWRSSGVWCSRGIWSRSGVWFLWSSFLLFLWSWCWGIWLWWGTCLCSGIWLCWGTCLCCCSWGICLLRLRWCWQRAGGPVMASLFTSTTLVWLPLSAYKGRVCPLFICIFSPCFLESAWSNSQWRRKYVWVWCFLPQVLTIYEEYDWIVVVHVGLFSVIVRDHQIRILFPLITAMLQHDTKVCQLASTSYMNIRFHSCWQRICLHFGWWVCLRSRSPTISSLSFLL